MNSKLGNDPLSWIGNSNDNFSKKIESEIEVKDLDEEIINKIDFFDNTYINRIYEELEELEDEELKELEKSIEVVGLINPVYLQKKENGKYRLVSGLRRSLAVKNLLKDKIEYKSKNKVIILSEDAPKNEIEKISLHENIKRKDLKVLELSYKINIEAKRQGKTTEELAKEYELGERQILRIKKAINYPEKLKEILEEVGIKKAEILDRIIREDKTKEVTELIREYKDWKYNDLTIKLKELKEKNKKKIKKVNIKYGKIGAIIKINKKISKELEEEIKRFIKKCEEE